MAKKKEEKQEEKKAVQSITSFVRNMFKKNAKCDSKSIIEAVKKLWPESRINSAHVSFYKNKFRKEGMTIASAREIKPEKKETKKEAKKKGA